MGWHGTDVDGVIDPANVSAVLVTRGDVDLGEIVDSILDAGIKDVIVWNNRERPVDLSCYGRYAAISEAKHDVIYQQDDDLVAPVADILNHYGPVVDRRTIVANNRPDEEWLLTAMGTIFHRSLAEGCFDAYTARYGFDADFCRVSDVVFAYQHPYRRICLGYRDLPWQTAPNRMYHQPDHYLVRERARDRVLELAREVAA